MRGRGGGDGCAKDCPRLFCEALITARKQGCLLGLFHMH